MTRSRRRISPARAAAFRVLSQVDRGRRLDLAFRDHAPGLPSRERAWVHALTYGVARLRGRLDHLLGLHLKRGVESVDPSLLVLLRMGAYQLVGMASVPPYAAVSQTVSQVREEMGRGAAGLANAVLRGLSREGGGEERFPSFQADPVAHMVTWGSHPRWMVERWIVRYGPEETRRLVEVNNRIPGLHVRPVGIGQEEAVARLGAAGIRARPARAGSGTLELAEGTDPEAALAVIPAVVQDPAAGLVVGWVGPVNGLTVADLCAAPGGKGVGLADLGARVAAMDPSPSRLALMRGTLERLRLGIPVVVGRAEDPPFRRHDVVLVDAPCSGTGTLARHPDARWRLDPGAPARIAEAQARILEGAARIVRPGGLLVYATCTLEPEENEERVEAFLRGHAEFIVEEGTGLSADVRRGPFLEVLPQRTGTDGAFAARLRRREEAEPIEEMD